MEFILFYFNIIFGVCFSHKPNSRSTSPGPGNDVAVDVIQNPKQSPSKYKKRQKRQGRMLKFFWKSPVYAFIKHKPDLQPSLQWI